MKIIPFFVDKPRCLDGNQQKSHSHFQTFYSKPKWWSQPKKLTGPGSLKAVQQARGEIGICGESILIQEGIGWSFHKPQFRRFEKISEMDILNQTKSNQNQKNMLYFRFSFLIGMRNSIHKSVEKLLNCV